jgi:hypothetical protein
MRAHDDQIGRNRLRRPQHPIERLAECRDRAAANAAEFRRGIDQLAQIAANFRGLARDLVGRPVIVDDMNEHEIGVHGQREQACPPQGSLRSGGEVRGSKDLHRRPALSSGIEQK